MVEQDPGPQGDVGALLAAMATDAPPVPTVSDEPPQPGSPIDAALAVFYSACQASDAADSDRISELHEQRQGDYRSAINDKIGGSS